MAHGIMKAALLVSGPGMLGLAFGGPAMSENESGEPIRVGLIGLDTSHVIAFTSILNDPRHPEHVPGARVVAGFKGGSRDIEASWSRVDKFTQQLRDRWSVEIVDSIPALCEKVNAVMITSVDGRPHLEQARHVIEARLPFFVDKPIAGSLKDAVEMARLAKRAGVPWFGGSSLRWYRGVREAIDPDNVGEIMGCDAYSPCSMEPHHPDLFWYGVHGIEILFAAMGPGCKTVSRTSSERAEVVVGVWEDGRVGTYRGIRSGKGGYGATVFGTKAITTVSGHSYRGLVERIVEFFKTKQPPISAEEMLEALAFMEAADESKRRGGAAVGLPDFSIE